MKILSIFVTIGVGGGWGHGNCKGFTGSGLVGAKTGGGQVIVTCANGNVQG